MNNPTEANDTATIAGSVRYWMMRLEQERSSVALRNALECSAPRARDLYNGRRAFTLAELVAVSDWLGVPCSVLSSGSCELPEDVPTRTDKTAAKLDGIAKGLAALVWNSATAMPEDDFLDMALFNEIRSIVDIGAAEGKPGALAYCMRMTVHEFAKQISLFMPNRPEMDLPAAS